MKKIKLSLAFIASFAILTDAHAALTGTLTLTGSIAANVSIVVNTLAAASTLDLTANQTDLAVANVDEVSNDPQGYKITASSANNGTIKHSTNADNVAYTIKYDGGSSVALTTSAQDLKTVAVGGHYVDNSAVSISYTGSGTLVSGTYSDVITFTIVAL